MISIGGMYLRGGRISINAEYERFVNCQFNDVSMEISKAEEHPRPIFISCVFIDCTSDVELDQDTISSQCVFKNVTNLAKKPDEDQVIATRTSNVRV